MNRLSLIVSTVGFLSAGFACAGADGLIASPEPGWPQWRGPRRDGISDERGLLRQWPEGGPHLAWKIGGVGQGWSSPVVVRDTIYITGDVEDDLVVFAFDLEGKPRWRATNGKAWKGAYPGARAACAYSEGRLYHLNAHGRLACYGAGDGGEQWCVNVLDRFGAANITWALSECLLIDGPRVIVTPGGQALLAALDKRNGKTVWATPNPGRESASHAAPILFRHAGRRVIAGCSSARGFGVDADTGEFLWSVPLKNQYGTNVSTPVYAAGRVFFVTPYAELGRQYLLRAEGAGMVAEQAWASPIDTVTGCAVLVGDTLYAAGYRKPKWWFAIDWKTGATMHERKDFTTGSAVYADGRLYVLDEQGNVGLFDPRHDGMELAGRFRLGQERLRDAWAHPVVAGGRLYLRHHDALWCYDIKGDASVSQARLLHLHADSIEAGRLR